MSKIQSVQYGELGMIEVLLDDGTLKLVPDDMANADRQELEQWSMVKGNMIEPYHPPEELEATPKVKSKLKDKRR